MLMEARMKARLSSIDTRAKPGAKLSTRKKRNAASLHHAQQPEYEALVG